MNKGNKRSINGELLTLDQTCEVFNLGASTIRRLAKECGAEIKIGRACRYVKDEMSKYILMEYRR